MPIGLNRYSHCKFSGITEASSGRKPARIKMAATETLSSRLFLSRLLRFIGCFVIFKKYRRAYSLFIRHGFLTEIETVKSDFTNGESGKLGGQTGNHEPATRSEHTIR